MLGQSVSQLIYAIAKLS